MKTGAKVIIGIASAMVVFILVGIGLLGGAYYYMDHRLHEPKLRAKLDKAWEDGEKFGKTTDQNGCMAKALTFNDSQDSFDLSNNDFDHACLSAARPSPKFCNGVDLKFGGEWPEQQCGTRTFNRETCVTAYENKLLVCRFDAGK